MIAPVVLLLAAQSSTTRACTLLGKPRGRHYRDRQPVPVVPAQPAPRASPPNALSTAEQDAIITVLTSPRFCDKSVAQTWATLLDEGRDGCFGCLPPGLTLITAGANLLPCR